MRRALHDLRHDLASVFVVECTAAIAEHATALVTRHPLRGSDAIHLASALELGRATGAPALFCCFDARLTRAAAGEGLSTGP
jgi:predicted nucleic acid-binding protein